jgi:hypothetical protein
MGSEGTGHGSAFTIELLGDVPRAKRAKRRRARNDHIMSLVDDLCAAMEKADVRFVVSGFGQDGWPVDVSTDLAVVIVQVPGVLDALRRRAPCELGFYEQGVERTLYLTPTASHVEIVCASATLWQPSPAIVRMRYSELARMLTGLLARFVELARAVSTEWTAHPLFVAWIGPNLPAPTLFQVAQCPIDYGPVFALKGRAEKLFFYAPCCGVAFTEPPDETWKDVLTLSDFAGACVQLPTRPELAAAGFGGASVSESPHWDWAWDIPVESDPGAD